MQDESPKLMTAPERVDSGGLAPEDRLLTKAETCAILGITYPTIWGLVREGKFPRGRYIGARVFWLASEIEAFIAALPKQGTNDEPPGRDFPGTKACLKSDQIGRPRKQLVDAST